MEMTEEEFNKAIAAPEKLQDPRQINAICSFLSGIITDKEMELDELNYQVSLRWHEIRETLKTNAEADRQIEMEEIYRHKEKCKLSINKFRRLRSDLKDKFEVIVRGK